MCRSRKFVVSIIINSRGGGSTPESLMIIWFACPRTKVLSISFQYHQSALQKGRIAMPIHANFMEGSDSERFLAPRWLESVALV